MDTTAVAGLLGALATAVTAVLLATARRREIRAREWDTLMKENKELRQDRDAKRRAHDALLDWAFSARDQARHKGLDLPPMPEDRG